MDAHRDFWCFPKQRDFKSPTSLRDEIHRFPDPKAHLIGVRFALESGTRKQTINTGISSRLGTSFKHTAISLDTSMNDKPLSDRKKYQSKIPSFNKSLRPGTATGSTPIAASSGSESSTRIKKEGRRKPKSYLTTAVGSR